MLNMRDFYFFLATLKLFLPGNRYIILRKYIVNDYVHARDKHPVREKHFGGGGWTQERLENGCTYRDYKDYEEYKTHQVQKITELLKAQGGLKMRNYIRQRIDFWNRFKNLKLAKNSSILCLGARFGTEVEVLRDLGYHNAIGIDLEPGPDNPYVVPGDFMNLNYNDRSVDLIYCNAVDHAFNLDEFFKEHARVLKADGAAIYDLCMTPPGAFESVDWGEERNVISLMMKHFKTIEKISVDRFWKTVCLRNPL